METKGGSETLFTSRHLKLLNIAQLCVIIAWIFIGISTLSSVVQLISYLDIVTKSDIYGIFILFNPLLTNFAKDLAVFVALLGISMGLRMIIDTDINYRIRKEENSDEHL